MKPYYEITDDIDKDAGIFIFEIESIGSFWVMERYCTRPSCNCRQVVLEFGEHNDDSVKSVIAVMPLCLDTWQWKSEGEHQVEKNSPAEELLHSFRENLPDDLKSSFLRHYKKAKEYGIKHPLDYLDPEVLESGKNIFYFEVFGNEHEEMFRFNMDGQEYIFHDQYCINPKCDCQEALIAITCVGDGQATDCGAVSVGFNGECEVVDGIGGFGPVREWLKQGDRLPLLRDRYKKMKEIARNLSREIASKKERRVEQQVGRNEPCPCGSGKKFKKCCGRG